MYVCAYSFIYRVDKNKRRIFKHELLTHCFRYMNETSCIVVATSQSVVLFSSVTVHTSTWQSSSCQTCINVSGATLWTTFVNLPFSCSGLASFVQ
jgi:hypothetical protein